MFALRAPISERLQLHSKPQSRRRGAIADCPIDSDGLQGWLPMKANLDKGESLEIYTPYGGGVTLTFTATSEGLRVSSIDSRLRIREERKPYVRRWTISREDEHGFDRT